MTTYVVEPDEQAQRPDKQPWEAPWGLGERSYEALRTALTGLVNSPNRAFLNSPKRPGTGLCWSVPTGWVNIVVSLGPQIHCMGAASAVPILRILHLQKCKLSSYSIYEYCILCIYIAGMFVYTFDFVELVYIQMSTNQEGSKKVKDKNQRHILRDRRPGRTACPACWTMRTNEVK